MTRSSRRRARALLLAAGTVFLAGCAAGQDAQTAYQSPAIDGANGGIGQLALRDVRLSYPPDGVYRAGSDARLELVLINGGGAADRLVGVRSDAAGSSRVQPAGGGSSTGSAGAPAGVSGTGSGSTPGGVASTAVGTKTPTGSASPGLDTSTPSASPPPTQSGVGPGAAGSPTDTTIPTNSGAAGPAPGSATSTATPSGSASGAASAPVELPPSRYVSFRADNGNVLTLQGLTRALLPTQTVPVTFVFEKAGELTMLVPVGVPTTAVPAPPTTDLNPPAEQGGVASATPTGSN